MRIFIILVLIFGYTTSSEKKLVITEKQISVSGETSLGGFTCNYTNEDFKDTLFINSSKNNNPIVFDIPVQDFGCGNFLLNKDFRKTIKASEYPHAKVTVNNLREYGIYYTCDVSVNLVGKKLAYKSLKLKYHKDQLVGKISINFDELDLSPPSKLGGLIKVEEKLNLEIKLGF
ncbi:hypothetical protein MM236_02840 [Belliella sp. DSM 107340]|uniref:YceI-like domain-containing protein n=1 Tax=Belliella calami TaxID=2923436 RepID=A0ABS9UJV0_9BACT|nr:hypothetical protein [Belliella calami]MCH7396902.1 hypothetical protein [Belliella calami]